MNTRPFTILGRLLFFLGAGIGLALAGVMIWNQVEAIHYYFEGAKFEQFRGLQCPLTIAPAEKGIVAAAFTNPTDEEIIFYYRAEISGPISSRRVEGHIPVPARQSRRIELTVDANDVDLLYFIFVKMDVLPNALQGSQQSVCGIRIMKIPGLAGRQIPAVALSLSFLGMGVGLALGQRAGNKKDRSLEKVMQVLGVIVVLTLLAGTVGWWLPGMVLAAMTILLMIISVRMAIE